MNKNFRKPQEYSIKFYIKLDYLYKMLVNSKESDGNLDIRCFYDGTKISNWLTDNLYKLEKIKDENIKAKYILSILNNKKKKRKKENEEIFYKKLEELYTYYLKTGTIPNYDSNELFKDDTNMYSWITNHKDKLCEIRSRNYMANIILRKYEKSENLKETFNTKLKEVYQYCIKYNALPDDTSAVLFSDGTSMNNWLRIYIKQLQQIRDENKMADIILNTMETTKVRKKIPNLNQKINELYDYYKKTKDILIKDETQSFLDGTKYTVWFKNNISRIRSLRKVNNKAYMLVLAHDFNKSLTYNKKLLEVYKYCLTTNKIPSANIKQKLSNGCNMGIWLKNNKYFIWVNRKNNPYCLQLVKIILKIRPNHFKNFIRNEDEKIQMKEQMKSRVLFKVVKRK